MKIALLMSKLFLLGLAVGVAAHAAEVPAGDEHAKGPPDGMQDFKDRRGFGVGLAVAYSDEPYRGMDSDVMPFPILRYRGKRFSALGPNLSYLLIGLQGPWSFSATLSPAFDGYDADDSSFLDGMDDRDKTVEGGFEVEYDTDIADFSLSYKHDLLNEHDGYQVDVGVRKPWFVGRFIIAPSVSYNYWSDDRSDYYFGVRAEEATAVRPEYELDGTSNWDAGVFASTDITRRVFALAGAGYTYYDDDIRDSPIVSADGKFRVFVGFGYMFGTRKPAGEEENLAALLRR